MTRLTGRKKKSDTTKKKSVKIKKPMAAKDTTHVNTTGGYKIVVKKGSPYDKQAKEQGAVINQLRPRSGGKKKDPLAVKNYNKRYK